MNVQDLSEIRDEETMGVCGELVGDTQMTEPERERIRARVLSEVAPQKRARRKQRLIKIGAGLAATFMLAACSAEMFKWDIRLSKLFETTQEDREYAENSGLFKRYTGIKATDNNITVELKEMLADKKICYMVFEVNMSEKPADANFFPCYRAQVVIDGEVSWIGSVEMPQSTEIIDENRFTLSVIAKANNEDWQDGQRMNVQIGDITYNCYSSTGGYKRILGCWDLEFDLSLSEKVKRDTTDVGCVLEPQDEYENKEKISGRIKNYELTPLTLMLNFESDEVDDVDKLSDKSRGNYADESVKIYYDDGTFDEIKLAYGQLEMTSVTPLKEKYFETNFYLYFNKVIDVDRVTAIEFAGGKVAVTR